MNEGKPKHFLLNRNFISTWIIYNTPASPRNPSLNKKSNKNNWKKKCKEKTPLTYVRTLCIRPQATYLRTPLSFSGHRYLPNTLSVLPAYDLFVLFLHYLLSFVLFCTLLHIKHSKFLRKSYTNLISSRMVCLTQCDKRKGATIHTHIHIYIHIYLVIYKK